MKDLTAIERTELLDKIKSFCDVTWDDIDTENLMWDMIETSIHRIDAIAGIELNYLARECDNNSDPLFTEMCRLGQDLLRNRVFYQREKGLDDFESNYRGELNALYIYGKAIKARAN